MFFSESTSVVVGLVWAAFCIGLGTAPQLALIGRGLWARARARFRRRRG